MKNLDSDNKNIENLIHTYLNGTISQDEKDILFRWLTSNPENVIYFNQVSDIWLSSSVFQNKEDFNSDEAFNRVKAKIKYVNNRVKAPKKRNIVLSWQRVAAVLIPVVLLSGFASKLLFTGKSHLPTPFLFEVPYGSKASLFLPDGSKVVLNAGSKITCDEGFGKTNRVLNLVGEGYFSVAKNKNLPFVVKTENISIKALGTEFNVKAYPEEKNVEAILIHGSIQVNKIQSIGKNAPVILMPNQRLVYQKKSDIFQVNVLVKKNENEPVTKPLLPEHPIEIEHVTIQPTEIDPVIYTSWKDPSWNIYRMSLSDLAVELERKYDVKIQFDSDAVKGIIFTGTLRDESLEQILAAIRLTSPIEYKVKGKNVILTENKNLMPAYNQYYHNSK